MLQLKQAFDIADGFTPRLSLNRPEQQCLKTALRCAARHPGRRAAHSQVPERQTRKSALFPVLDLGARQFVEIVGSQPVDPLADPAFCGVRPELVRTVTTMGWF